MTERENEFDVLRQQLGAMELRLRSLEAALLLSGIKESEAPAGQKTVTVQDFASGDGEKGLETRIGRFGLAWLGNIVLLFGIVFLSQYLISLGHPLVAAILGYSASAAIYFVSEYFRRTNEHLSFIFSMNAQIILFFVTLRLHYFTPGPLVGPGAIAVCLLLLVTSFQVWMWIRNRSQAFAGLSVIFSLVTAILSDSSAIILPLLILTAVAGVFMFLKYSWKTLLVFTIVLTYLVLFTWLLGNPLIGHQVKVIKGGMLSLAGLLPLGAIYSSLVYSRKSDDINDGFLSGTAVLNGFFFTLMLLFITVSFFSSGYVGLYTCITASCLAFSVVLFRRSDWNFASAFYALYGFMAMSIALFGLVGFPRVYLLLSVQSLLVVSMALWFRNKLIVIMNSFLFTSILLLYLFTSKADNGVNFSFALSALLSARIINWQRFRLMIRTDLIRNMYMILGFVMMLVSLTRWVPKQFVTLSWTMAALLYFIISIILKNVKYRYMALGTMICAALYLFIIDLARIEIVYRVMALLFLAAISIGISIYYTNRAGKHDERE